MIKTDDLTKGSVGRELFRLTLPMIFGVFAIMAFNVIDTYFVAKLGTKELAAMAFTFPVVFVIGAITMGLGVAASSVISRAIGRKDFHQVRRLTVDALLLSVIIVVIFIFAGLATMKTIFTSMGATSDIYYFIEKYMRVWYIGVGFLVIPMVGNNAIRASGDMVTPAVIMTVSAILNTILDPLLIFGLAGFPRMGIEGAALATVITRSVSLIVSLSVLHFSKRMLEFFIPTIKELIKSWGEFLYVGIPSAISNVLFPITIGVVTRMVAFYGPEAVAGFGAAMRFEAFALIILMALSTAIVPFVGQNWGAKRFDRVHLAQREGNSFALLWGALCFIVLYFSANLVGRIFSDDPGVIKNIADYLRIMPLGYGFGGVCMLTVSIFNAINKPIKGILLNAIRFFVLYIPLAYLGFKIMDIKGIYFGLVLGSVIGGVISIVWIRHTCRACEK